MMLTKAADVVESGVPLAAALLLFVSALVLGFFVGAWRAGRARLSRHRVRRRDRDDNTLCECGVLLSNTCTPQEVARHKSSTRHRRNLQLLSVASEVIVCEEVGEYRDVARTLVGKDDVILEVGCHVGGTTKVLAGVCRRLVGLDQQPQLVAEARERLPGIQFEIADAFDAPRVIALAKSIRPDRFTKVFIDISGSRDLSTVVRLMDIFENTLRPDMMVVKSQALKRILLRSQLWIHHPDCTPMLSQHKAHAEPKDSDEAVPVAEV
eukprot:CAMPEP_0180639262 /NCGR_PEP_ID=MMETSP1037_2-20121125/44868_1 /TAXON_ID=632150 /ORGANISM="Azadinium spinosum, Strain 3D9" /LENGTH=265 /DNA_ID=CAMNT_0022661053 /DNA_START=142 /DNA_END=940 /DNA_ORIENTATION=-